jgi:hypothetical protein
VKVQKDSGCAFAGPSCLACELPVCVFDLPLGKRQRLFAAHGLAYAEDAGV